MLASVGLRAGLVLGAVVAVLLAISAWERAVEQRGMAKCQVAYAQAEREGRAEVDRLAARARAAQGDRYAQYRTEVSREKARADAAGRQLERLRIAAAIASRGDAASAPSGAASGVDGASEHRRLLVEGGELAAEGRRLAGELAAKVTALQGELRACTAEPGAGK